MGQHVQRGGFARAGRAGEHDVQFRLDRRAQEAAHRFVDCYQPHQVVQRLEAVEEFPDAGILFGVKTVNIQFVLPGGFQKSGFIARKNMAADNFSVVSRAFVLENVEVLQLIFPIFQGQHFGDGRDFSGTVMQPGRLQNNVNG